MFVQIFVQALLICAGQCALGHVMVEDVENILIQTAHVGQRGVIVDASRLEIVMALVGVVVVGKEKVSHYERPSLLFLNIEWSNTYAIIHQIFSFFIYIIRSYSYLRRNEECLWLKMSYISNRPAPIRRVIRIIC